MKYKCIKQYAVDNTVVMKPGDIVVMNEGQIYNITTGYDYRGVINEEEVKYSLETITDSEPKSNDPFKEILDNMYDTFKRKNHDYGNSFDESLDEEGLTAARVRLGDKWNRFKNLSKSRDKFLVKESLQDTLLDMSIYCIMTVMWMNK